MATKFQIGQNCRKADFNLDVYKIVSLAKNGKSATIKSLTNSTAKEIKVKVENLVEDTTTRLTTENIETVSCVFNINHLEYGCMRLTFERGYWTLGQKVLFEKDFANYRIASYK